MQAGESVEGMKVFEKTSLLANQGSDWNQGDASRIYNSSVHAKYSPSWDEGRLFTLSALGWLQNKKNALVKFRDLQNRLLTWTVPAAPVAHAQHLLRIAIDYKTEEGNHISSIIAFIICWRFSSLWPSLGYMAAKAFQWSLSICSHQFIKCVAIHFPKYSCDTGLLVEKLLGFEK